jgi:hypothetical protein
MTRELKPELDPLSGPERLALFCVASRMDTAIAGLPPRTAELLVMKDLARRDQARLSLTEQGRATLYSLLGDGGNHDGRDASPRVRTSMPPSLALASLIRRRLMALTVRSRRPVTLGDLDDAVAAVSLRSKRRHPCGRSKRAPEVAEEKSPGSRPRALNRPPRAGEGGMLGGRRNQTRAPVIGSART